ncbi:MAG: hypothetical protein H6540_08325 [Bacteroidales bacterium]|nr:hypothetical protein [Bacteroidales bacterium]MCP5515581.1 hypothetical protein [Spirochaetales bacterium]
MKKACLTVLLILVTITAGFGQNLIGIPKAKAEAEVKTQMRGFNLDNSSKNESFNYLKFVNSAGTKTLIVFFSDENISTRTRMVCDYSEFDFIVEDFNKNYKKITKTSWEYSSGDEKFLVTLEEKEWYFVVTTQKKK